MARCLHHVLQDYQVNDVSNDVSPASQQHRGVVVEQGLVQQIKREHMISMLVNALADVEARQEARGLRMQQERLQSQPVTHRIQQEFHLHRLRQYPQPSQKDGEAMVWQQEMQMEVQQQFQHQVLDQQLKVDQVTLSSMTRSQDDMTLESLASSSDQQSQSDVPMTTLMIRNVPVRYTRAMLLSEWPNYGTYDYLYLPLASAGRNLSYAFINFVSEAHAHEFKAKWQKKRLASYSSKKALNISFAQLQGLEANLAQSRWNSGGCPGSKVDP